MNWKILQQRRWLNLIGVIILVVGLASSGWVFYRAGNAPYGALGYEVVGGTSYPIMPEHSKIYRHNLEVYGGRFSVIMDDFRRWFVGLWQGKSLAVIIAGAAMIISGGFFYAANYLMPHLKLEVQKDKNPEETG